MPIIKLTTTIHDQFSQNGKPESETFHNRKQRMNYRKKTQTTHPKTHTSRKEKENKREII